MSAILKLSGISKRFDSLLAANNPNMHLNADGFGSREFLKDRYINRMAAAVLGIYGNSKEEATYPVYFIDSSGQKLDASSRRCTLRLGANELPPVNAFWSLTLYELPSSLLSTNTLNRYVINSPTLPDLKRDADGGSPCSFSTSRRQGQRGELAARAEGPVLHRHAHIAAQAGGIGCHVESSADQAGELKTKGDQYMKTKLIIYALAAALTVINGTEAQSREGNAVPVTPDNFIRAESDLYFGKLVKDGGFGKFTHNRELTPIDKQLVVRSNRDTLNSSAVFDLDAGPVTITLPDAGKHFMSMQVIDEDMYTPQVIYDAGSYTFAREQIGTRYVLLGVRILVDPTNPDDVKRVHNLQDAIKVSQHSPGSFEVPNWDPASQKRVRNALLVLAATLADTNRMFGTKEQVNPVRRLIGAASVWGGNPEKDAIYLNVTPSKNDGTTIYKLNVKDVPVDGFWSVSVYNAEGYYQSNEPNAYSLNNITAKKSEDGSVAIQFGGCDGTTPNRLPIMKGWNYMVRLYRPRAVILNGKWKFPEAQPVS